MHHEEVRTTINLDAEVLERTRRFAESRAWSLGRALSELARRGLDAQRPVRMIDGVYVFDLPEDSPVVSTEHVAALEAETP